MNDSVLPLNFGSSELNSTTESAFNHYITVSFLFFWVLSLLTRIQIDHLLSGVFYFPNQVNYGMRVFTVSLKKTTTTMNQKS